MPEHDWRPRDAAERAHEKDRVKWFEANHAQRVPPAEMADKDAIFTSEEAVNFDRGVVDAFDPAKGSWTPHQERAGEVQDLDLREEKLRDGPHL